MSTESTTATVPDPLVIPLNPDGTFGALPDRLQRFINDKIQAAARRAEPLPDPVDKERVRILEDENKAFKLAEAERQQKYDEAKALIQKEWQDKLTAKDQEVSKRTERLLESLKDRLEAEAIKQGARPEVVADLATLLRARVRLSDDLKPIVVDEAGAPTDLTIDALVKQKLDTSPSYRQAGSPGGGARGGASFAGAGMATEVAALETALHDAQHRVQTEGPTTDAINAVFQANRALKTARDTKR